MTPADCEWVRWLVRSQAAIALDEGKTYLIESRLAHLAAELGLESAHRLVTRARLAEERGLRDAIVEAMTTHETSFFRDDGAWAEIREVVLPELVRTRTHQKRLRIWSAACSTGQEPYSLAMVWLNDFGHLVDWSIQILATDLAAGVLHRAQEGIYADHELDRGVDTSFRRKFFRRTADGRHAVTSAVRSLVQFDQVNLAGSWSHAGPFDLIFLRNVLIYFDPTTKRNVLARMERALEPDGYLLLGSGETTVNLGVGLVKVDPRRGWVFQRGHQGGACAIRY